MKNNSIDRYFVHHKNNSESDSDGNKNKPISEAGTPEDVSEVFLLLSA